MKKLWIAVLLTAALFATNSAMASVTITVQGTITSGTDTTGVFGAVGANLAGDSVTIVYTINDATGTLTTTCASITCASSVTGVTSSAAISVGSSTPYVDSSTASLSRELYSLRAYFEEITSTDTYVQVSGNTTTTVSSFTPNFDWRSAFSDSSSSDSDWSTLADFSINDGTNEAGAAFTVSSITQSGGDCSGVSSAVLAIDTSSTGQHPNILGGAVSANQSTVIGLTLSPVSSSNWYPVSFIDNDIAANPTSSNETFDPPGAIADSTTGLGTVNYLTALAGGIVNDAVTASVCAASPSPALNVFEYYPYFSSAHTARYDIGQSQVSDAEFTNTSVTASQIQTFLDNVVSGGSFLSAFYFDSTNPSNGGWVIPETTGALTSTYSGTPDDGNTYCPTSLTCPISGDTGTLAATDIVSIASSNSINPELLAVKLQKEASLTQQVTLPSATLLNNATGCTASDFLTQLNCAAETFEALYTDPSGDYGSGGKYFFPVNAASVGSSIQYPYTSTANCNGTTSLNAGCALVGFWINNAATETQYHYTPFIQTSAGGGGVWLFEDIWWKYNSNYWYQY